MDHLMLVKNLFNDMFVFLNGTQPLPLESLDDVYQGGTTISGTDWRIGPGTFG